MTAVINTDDVVSAPRRSFRRRLFRFGFSAFLVVAGAGLVLQRPSHRYDGGWALVAADSDGMTVSPGLPLQIDGDTITGSAPCSDFSGQLEVEMFHTLAGCIDHDGATFPPGLEERFMTAILGTIERNGDTLTFTSSDANLTYQRAGDVADHTLDGGPGRGVGDGGGDSDTCRRIETKPSCEN